VLSIDSYWYGTKVVGIFVSALDRHLGFYIFPFSLATGTAKFNVDEKIYTRYWLNAVNCLGAKPSEEKNRKLDLKLFPVYMCARSG